LGVALDRMSKLTQQMGSARITIDPSIYSSPFVANVVHPPAGADSSITILHRLIGEAGATGTLVLCLQPEGGLRVQVLKH
jgi:hypothetical protein